MKGLWPRMAGVSDGSILLAINNSLLICERKKKKKVGRKGEMKRYAVTSPIAYRRIPVLSRKEKERKEGGEKERKKERERRRDRRENSHVFS